MSVAPDSMTDPALEERDAGDLDPRALFERRVVTELPKLLASRGIPVEASWLRSQLDSTQEGRADYAVALHRPARAKGLDPVSLAEEIAAAFPLAPGFASVTAAQGFVNFRVDPVSLAQRTLQIVQGRAAQYGYSEAEGPRTCVEHTSANPTGGFHIGRVRNGLIGDTLARVLAASGSPVIRQYYVDDIGRQAAMISWIWSKPVADWPAPIRASLPEDGLRPAGEKPDRWFGRPYPAVSEWIKQHSEAAEEVAALSGGFEAGRLLDRHRELMEEILGGMLASLERLGIRFDEQVWESSLITDGSVAEAVRRLAGAPHAVVEPNGAHAIDISSYGLPKESARVIVTRANGSTLYPTRDVAYHIQKFARFKRAIDVLGQDHLLHARTLEALLAEVGETQRPEFVIYQDLTVPKGGRMSTRKGTAVSVDDLLDEATERARKEVLARREDLTEPEVDAIADKVGVGAVRYHILRVAPEKTVGFRWEDALSFEGRSGPFLQYAYARASSILRKSGVAEGPVPFDPQQLLGADEQQLIRRIARLPGVIEYVARTAHVHTLAQFGHELAEQFNRFYQNVPVLSAGAERASRLALVAAFRQTLGNVLKLLGLEPLERM